MTGRLLIDTGPIVAIVLDSDENHEVCVEQLHQIRGPILTCWPVITEVAWLLRPYPDAIRRFLASFGGRPFEVASMGDTDIPAIAAILARYESLGIQLADASLVHLAQREGLDAIFTLDRRDFGVLRLAHGKKLRLIP